MPFSASLQAPGRTITSHHHPSHHINKTFKTSLCLKFSALQPFLLTDLKVLLQVWKVTASDSEPYKTKYCKNDSQLPLNLHKVSPSAPPTFFPSSFWPFSSATHKHPWIPQGKALIDFYRSFIWVFWLWMYNVYKGLCLKNISWTLVGFKKTCKNFIFGVLISGLQPPS